MSDTIPTQHESAVAVLREMAREVEIEAQGLTESLKLVNARGDILQDAIAKLTRVPRARKVRTVTETPANDTPLMSVFAAPCAEEAA